MNTTVEALKGLYAALGGTAADVADITLIPDMIDAIAEYIGTGGAAELPPVTTTDNGKVLTVTGGKWAAAAPTAELPTVTATDNGKVLTVADGAWAAVTPE